MSEKCEWQSLLMSQLVKNSFIVYSCAKLITTQEIDWTIFILDMRPLVVIGDTISDYDIREPAHADVLETRCDHTPV